jgi:acetolactate synthase-1/2/3 large subunit
MSTPVSPPPTSVASLIADFLVANGVQRVFGLQGGHIQPVWDQLARRGVQIIDVRHEAAAVHMAQAQAELTGRPGVALVTAGPGVTNTVTPIANASIARVPVLVIGGCAPGPQANMGALQDIDHVGMLTPLTRRARTLREPAQVLREFSEAYSVALGDLTSPGPVYLEVPPGVLRAELPAGVVLPEHLAKVEKNRVRADKEKLQALVDALSGAQRVAVITGRGARQTREVLPGFLDATGGAYLDTQESRGLLNADHPAYVGSMRSRVMSEADVVVTLGRQLDYQLGYGSPAVFPRARFIRIADTSIELSDNRRGQVEVLADIAWTLKELKDLLLESGHRPNPVWRDELRRGHEERSARYRKSLGTAEDGSDGRMHPNRIFDALHQLELEDPVLVADGGDLLSFARLGLQPSTYLDPGSLGCLGVGVPYAVAAALEFPDRPVVSVNGDGAYGLNAMEVNTAVRHGAKAVFVVADNQAWNIERYDQMENYGLVVGTELGAADYAEMAEGLGAFGVRVQDPEDLVPALREALENAPAVVHVDVTREAVSPDAGKGLGFVPEYQALTPWDDREIARRTANQDPDA